VHNSVIFSKVTIMMIQFLKKPITPKLPHAHVQSICCAPRHPPISFRSLDAFLCTLHRNGSREYAVFRVHVFEVHPCCSMMAGHFLLSSTLLYGDSLSILLQVGGHSNCFHLGLLRVRMLLCVLSLL